MRNINFFISLSHVRQNFLATYVSQRICSSTLGWSSCATPQAFCQLVQVICQLTHFRENFISQYIILCNQNTAHPSPKACDFWLANLRNLTNPLRTCATWAILQADKSHVRFPKYGPPQPKSVPSISRQTISDKSQSQDAVRCMTLQA